MHALKDNAGGIPKPVNRFLFLNARIVFIKLTVVQDRFLEMCHPNCRSSFELRSSTDLIATDRLIFYLSVRLEDFMSLVLCGLLSAPAKCT